MENNNLIYSETTSAFMSFLTSKPKWYLNFKNRYYSFDQSNNMWLHNSNYINQVSSYNELSQKPTASNHVITHISDTSSIKILANEMYSQTKTFDNILFNNSTLDGTLMDIKFNTRDQNANIIQNANSTNMTLREDTYKMAIPRASENGNTYVQFEGRLKGKYLVSQYTFKTPSGNMFSIPYIETTYRNSII